MPRNRKPCSASISDCPRPHLSRSVMQAPKTAPEEPAKLHSNQAPETLSEEPAEQQVQKTAVSQGFRDAVYSIWLSRTRNQIKHVETQIEQREQDIQRTSELFLRLHEDIARWTSEKVLAAANLKQLKELADILVDLSLKTEEVD